MSVCARCGHVLGVGRFCTNCGHPVDAPAPVGGPDPDWRTGTAERPAVTADAGPPRYPLYADQTAESAAVTTGSHRAVTGRRTPWLPWLLGALALVLVAGLGTWLLLAGGEDDEPTRSADPGASSPAGPSAEPSDEPSDQPDDTGSPSPSEETSAPPQDPTEVAGDARVSVPATAPPNEDVDGNPVRYDGDLMLDGVTDTCWRMPGDGSGETLTFTLDGPTELTAVGLVNGYAKSATDGGRNLDWYAGNRRVLAVVWEFDDGTTVSQDLEETRDLQTVRVDATTETVELTLVTVSEPGTGPSRRDYTAISEVSLRGVPAE